MVRNLLIFSFVVVLTMTAYGMGHATGYAIAHKSAYDTRNVLEGLEMACLNLWGSEQNYKYSEMNK